MKTVLSMFVLLSISMTSFAKPLDSEVAYTASNAISEVKNSTVSHVDSFQLSTNTTAYKVHFTDGKEVNCKWKPEYDDSVSCYYVKVKF